MDIDTLAKICTPDLVRIVLVVQALLLGAGGVAGFVKAQSKPSLIAGVSSAVLLLACMGYSLVSLVPATIAAAVISDLLLIVFALRLSKTKKFMPSGLMLIICLLCGTYYVMSVAIPFVKEKTTMPGLNSNGNGSGSGSGSGGASVVPNII